MAVIVAQIGFCTSYKEMQRVEAFLNGEKVTWSRAGDGWNGQFVSPTNKRRQMIWFLARLECTTGDIVRMETKVFMKGAGPDEERSQVSEWQVDEDTNTQEYTIRRVGDDKFPLLSGKVTLINSRAMIEDRIDQGENLIRESQE